MSDLTEHQVVQETKPKKIRSTSAQSRSHRKSNKHLSPDKSSEKAKPGRPLSEVAALKRLIRKDISTLQLKQLKAIHRSILRYIQANQEPEVASDVSEEVVNNTPEPAVETVAA